MLQTRINPGGERGKKMDKKKATKKMITWKILCCFLVFVILISAIPFSALASNSSDDVMGDALNSLSEIDTHEDIIAVNGFDATANEEACDLSDSNITGNVSNLVTVLGVTDTLTANVKNTLGYSLPNCGGRIKVALFDEGYHFKESMDVPYSGGKSSCPVTFYGVTDGKYFIEVYQTPNTGLKLSEFWGADGVTVSGSTTKKDFLRHTQWVSDVKINGESPGNEIKVNPGEKVHVDITVKNDDEGAFSKNVKVRLMLTNDRSASSYDLDETHGPIAIDRNKEGYFGYDFKPSEAGAYYFYCVVYGDYNNTYIVVDQHDWCKAFDVKGPVILPVPYEFQDGTSWCGPASASMVLKYYGKQDHMWDLAREYQLGREKGANGNQIYNYIRSFNDLSVEKKASDTNPNIDDGDYIPWGVLKKPALKEYLMHEIRDERNPVILCTYKYKEGHCVVIVGCSNIDSENPTFYVNDPGDHFVSHTTGYIVPRIQHPVTWEQLRDYVGLLGGDTISVQGTPQPPAATMSNIFFEVVNRDGQIIATRQWDKGLKWNISGVYKSVITGATFPADIEGIGITTYVTTYEENPVDCIYSLTDNGKPVSIKGERVTAKRSPILNSFGSFYKRGFSEGKHELYVKLYDTDYNLLDTIGPLTFTVEASPTKADLTITKFDIQSNSCHIGDNITITFEVENQGNADAGPHTEAFLTYSEHLSTQFFTCDGLKPGETKTFSFTKKNIQGPTGSFKFKVKADVYEEIPEWDEGNNIEAVNLEVKLKERDTTPPETKCTLSPSSPNGEYGWYVTPVTVTLESTDDSSDIEWINYSIDSGSWQIYSGSEVSFTVSNDGVHYITYYAKDKAGNEENQKISDLFKIDQTNPSASLSINNGAEYTNSGSVTLYLSYSDATSGVRYCGYKNEGDWWGSWESCSSTKSWTLAAGEGTKKVCYQVRDNAGNTKEVYDTIILKQAQPKLCTSPDLLEWDFHTMAEGQTDSSMLYITNCGSGTLTWSVSVDKSWITVSPESGKTTTETDEVLVRVDTHGLSPGTYTGKITVTSDGGDKTGTITVKVTTPSNQPPVNPTLTPDKSSPQPAGTTIKWTASATDPDGDQLYYRFWLKGLSTGNSWSIKRDWSTDNTWTWSTSSADIGDTDISVWIRDGHHAPPDKYNIEKIVYDYKITADKKRPTATIDSITPNPATQGDDTVSFKGHGYDSDGYIVEYYWNSSKDGKLSSSKEFTKSASNLAVGIHTIYFKVKDDDDLWSDWTTGTLTIKKSITGKPDLIVSSINFKPNPASAGDDVVVSVTVRNQGKGDAGAHDEFLGQPYATIIHKEWHCSGLKAGASKTFTHTLKNVQESVTYEACADIGGVVAESDDDNNCRTAYLEVKEQSKYVKFRGVVTGTSPEGLIGAIYWYVNVDEWLSGSLSCDEIYVVIGMYPPFGSWDENICKGDRVEAYGEVNPWGDDECSVGLNGESYYIKKTEPTPQPNCKVQITSYSSLQDRPSIVYANGYYYVAYQSHEKGYGIFLEKFDSNWNFNKKVEVVSGSAYYDSPSLLFANNKLYVAYISNAKGANANDYDIIVKEYNPNSLSCTKSAKYLTSLHSCQDLPALYYKDGYFYTAYQSWETGNGDIYIKKFDSSWNQLKKVQVTSKSSLQDRPAITYANGYFYVAYFSEETGDYDIFVKRLDSNLNLASWKKQITSKSSYQSYPFITFVNNQFAISYASTESGTLGIYMKKYSSTWNFIEKTKVVDSSAYERRPSHTWDGSNFWVAYVYNYGDSKDWNIFAITPDCEGGAVPIPTPLP